MRPLVIRQYDSPSIETAAEFPDSNERSTFLHHHHNDDLSAHFEPRTLFPESEESQPSLIGAEIDEIRQRISSAVSKLLDRKSSDEIVAQENSSYNQTGTTCLSKLKYVYSTILLLYSVYVTMTAIFSQQTKFAQSTHPMVSFGVIWGLIIWLGQMEGGQGCLVGLQPINKAHYLQSHPVAHKCTILAHKGDNMYRFIVGRQFLVVLVVFVINLCGAVVPDITNAGLSDTASAIFLRSGLSTILLTVVLGQLTAQVNATKHMLDFCNNSFMLFTTWISLAIEMSGLLHSVYLVQYIFAGFSGKPVASNEPPRIGLANLFFWIRVLLSSLLLCAAFAVTLSAIFNGQTTMYTSVPPMTSVVACLLLMCFVGLQEGMQIALFAVVNLPEEELLHYPVARANRELTFRGSNFEKFLIGRQICVTMCMFIVARITTIAVDTQSRERTIFGVSNSVQDFLNTGLPGALITTIVASLAWRVIASSFPVAFLQNPLINWTIRLCLFLEGCGMCSAAWLLAAVQKHTLGFQLDEEYLGSPEKRDLDLDEDTTTSEVSSEHSRLAEYGATVCATDNF